MEYCGIDLCYLIYMCFGFAVPAFVMMLGILVHVATSLFTSKPHPKVRFTNIRDVPNPQPLNDNTLTLYSPSNITIHPGAEMSVRTGIILEVQRGLMMQVTDRHNTFRNKVQVRHDIIDYTDRDEIVLKFKNVSDKRFTIGKNEPVASVIAVKVLNFKM